MPGASSIALGVLLIGCGGEVVVDAGSGASGGGHDGVSSSVVTAAVGSSADAASSVGVGGAGGQPWDEAIQNVKEIAEAARAHFESTGALCGWAVPIPAAPPAGTSYVPSPLEGNDFNTGTVDEYGWKCLPWKPSQPAIHYSFGYNPGEEVTNYLGPAAGGPDPGPDGFEATAQGDLDADGQVSLFTVAGFVDPDTGAVTLSDVFIYDQAE